jgi:hypothetical protein
MIDVEKLVTFRNYGKLISKTRQWVYELAKEGKIEVIEIDGVKFVQL